MSKKEHIGPFSGKELGEVAVFVTIDAAYDAALLIETNNLVGFRPYGDGWVIVIFQIRPGLEDGAEWSPHPTLATKGLLYAAMMCHGRDHAADPLARIPFVE